MLYCEVFNLKGEFQIGINSDSKERMKMSGKVKFRNANRIYTTVEETAFQVGDKYTYTYDKANDALIITKSETGNTVSRKKSGSKVKPLIDIRDKATLSKFQDFEQLKIEVLETEVRVTGYKRKESASVLTKVISFSKFKREAKLQEAFQLSLSLDFVDQAVGENVSHTISKHFDDHSVMARVLRVVSLFSGAGFSDYGLLQAKAEDLRFEVIQAYDFAEAACKTYAHNLGNHIKQQDITQLDPKDVPQAEVMFASPSCFGFSAHNRSGSEESKENQNDLTRRAAEIIKANKACKVFIIENVKQMLTAEKGKYLQYFKELLSEFEITHGVLNSADFGAPQLRERAFIIGSKIGRIELPKPTHTPETYMTVAEALEGCHDGLPNMTGREDRVNSGQATLEKIAKVPWGGNWRDLLPEYENELLFKKDGTPRSSHPHSDIYHKLHPYKPARTITNFRKGCVSNPFTNRILTVREACRLMGLPDTYEILGKTAERIQQVANGVVPCVMTAIGHQVLKAFRNFYNGGCLQLLSN